MSDTQTYEAVLSPEGVPLVEADDTRVVRLDIPTSTPQGALAQTVSDHITATDAMDPWAFRNHWRIAALVRADAKPKHRLRDAVLSFAADATAAADLQRIEIEVRDDRTDTWYGTSLAVDDEIQTSFTHWKGQLEEDYADVWYLPDRYLGEAMVRTAADQKPMLADEFMRDPLAAAREFFQQCFMYGSTVAATTTEI